jgi:hypothetical protein
MDYQNRGHGRNCHERSLLFNFPTSANLHPIIFIDTEQKILSLSLTKAFPNRFRLADYTHGRPV